MTYRTNSLLRSAVCFGAMLSLFACVAQEADVLCSDLPMPERISSPTCVPPDAGVPTPTVTFPTWSTDYNQNQTVQVVPAAGWAIDLVEYSVDNGEWRKASSTGTNGYQVVLTDLDVGNNAIAVRVTSSYRGVTEVNLYYSTFSVNPVVNCDAASMLPDTQMISNNGTDTRTLRGYFGNPTEHSVTVVIAFTDLLTGNDFKNVGQITSQSRESITANFDVSSANCETDQGRPNVTPHDCDVPYGITVTVDGNANWSCTNANFGQVHTYWDTRG